MSIYTGFSTLNYYNGASSFNIHDIDLVKTDLLNHIYTIVGERVHMPTFGTRIPTLAFEQADEETAKIIKDDLQKVIDYDPRVQLINMQILSVPDSNAIAAIVTLKYVELDVVDDLHIEISS
jgi:phage baseplate assembly protein W